MKRKLWPWLLISLFVVLFDQASKFWVLNHIHYDEPVRVFSFLNLTLSYNQGSAFGFLTNAGGWQVWFFSIVAIVISILIFIWLTKLTNEEKLLSTGLSLVLGGAIGNLLDRVSRHFVVDFIDFHINNWHYATFNVADSAVCVGAFLVAITILFPKKPI